MKGRRFVTFSMRVDDALVVSSPVLSDEAVEQLLGATRGELLSIEGHALVKDLPGRDGAPCRSLGLR